MNIFVCTVELQKHNSLAKYTCNKNLHNNKRIVSLTFVLKFNLMYRNALDILTSNPALELAVG
jgi:hypothetical protein